MAGTAEGTIEKQSLWTWTPLAYMCIEPEIRMALVPWAHYMTSVDQ